MRMSINPIVYILPAICFLVSCQTAKLSNAEEKQRIGEYYEAAAIYRKVYTRTSPKKRSLRGYIAFRMAECNRLINQTPRAISGYANALRYQYKDSTVNFWLAAMYHKQGAYAEAIKYYTAYLASDWSDTWAKNGIAGAEMALQWRKNPTRYQVSKM